MRDRWRLVTRGVAFAAVLAACLVACGLGSLPPADDDGVNDASSVAARGCSPGKTGCSCTTPGQTVACGSVVDRTGDYVTCSMGYSTCNEQAWGPCLGNQIVTKSLSRVSLSARGPRTLSASVPCTNLCDPFACSSTQNGPPDVDASTVNIADAGVTLRLSEAGDAGTSCTGLQCAVPTCAGSATTSLSGFVYDPAGVNPLYNVLVYIPVAANGALPALATNATINQCSGASPVPAVAFTQTATDGSFTLTGIPAGTGIPALSGIPIVVQTGEWRRELKLTSITPCVTNTVTSTSCIAAIPSADCVLRLPGSQTDGYNYADGTYDHGDMPQIAIVTGHYDPFECLLLKIGISPNEFGSITNVNVSNSSSRRVHFFQSPDYPGTYLYKTYGDQLTGDKLWDANPSILPNYDVILLPCEGAPFDKMANAHPMAAQGPYPAPAVGTKGVPTTVNTPPGAVNPYANMIAYANAGGRIFATHYSYVWLEYPALFGYVSGDNWGAVATWDHPWSGAGTQIMDTNVYWTQDPLTGTFVQPATFPKGIAFAAWLANVGASIDGLTIPLHEARHDLSTVGATSQPWMTATDSNNFVSPQAFDPHFTFNTPYPAAAANQYGRVVFSDFHVSEQALVGAGTGGSATCSGDSDCGFGQSCVLGVPVLGKCKEPCNTTADCATSAYTCSGGQCTKSCNTNTDCSGGDEICTKSSGALCAGTAGCACHGCYTSSNCTSKQGLATCTGGTTGTCTPAAPSEPPNQTPAGPTPPTDIRAPWSLTGDGPTENNGWFPFSCAKAPLLAQEDALEFMFFDLTGCVSPDTASAPPPPPTYQPGTFTQTFTASCPSGSVVRWGEFDWQATVPSTASIQFGFQSGATAATVLPAMAPLPSVTATTTTPNLAPSDGGAPGWSTVILDNSINGSTVGTGLLNSASPPVASGNTLVVTITMDPTSADAGTSQTPTLIQWKVQSDCVSSE
jgi:hypothetical protein